MQTFFCKLIPPRPTFAQDMSPSEAKVMQVHAAYWKDKMDLGQVVTFGVVADPAGAYGIGIIEVENEDEARRFTESDPAILAGIGLRFGVLPMPRGAAHRGARTP